MRAIASRLAECGLSDAPGEVKDRLLLGGGAVGMTRDNRRRLHDLLRQEGNANGLKEHSRTKRSRLISVQRTMLGAGLNRDGAWSVP